MLRIHLRFTRVFRRTVEELSIQDLSIRQMAI
jgi:hypothetical protein